MKNIEQIAVSGKRTLIRVDVNVPLDKSGNIADDTRIGAILPTVRYALEHNAKVILASHLGRPKGKVVPEASLAPVAERLGAILNKTVKMAPDCVGPEVETLISEMSPGEVVLLENLRFHPEEQKNDPDFGRALASLCDVYINDAFAVCHRVNASVHAVARFVPEKGAGFLLQKELDYFKKAMDSPSRPLVAVVGGAKISSKLAALENMLRRVDKIVVGGAMANTFLKSRGVEVGNSLFEESLVSTAAVLSKTAEEKGIKLYVPVDAVVASGKEPDAEIKVAPVREIPAGSMIKDIGPATSLLYSEVLDDARTIVWNGPMGVFEEEAFGGGTISMAHAVGGSRALSIVGGGDTDAAIRKAGENERITYISTGGGAFLALLEGKTLPAVTALNNDE